MGDSREEELARLRAEVAQLRSRVEEPGVGMSRRRLLRTAPAVALGGALAAVAGGAPASASAGDPVLQGDDNTYAGTTSLTGGDDTHPAVSVSGSVWTDRVSVGISPVPDGDTICLVAPYVTYVAEPIYPTDPAMVVYGHTVGGGYRNKGLTAALHVEGLGPATALEVNIADGTSEPGGPIGDTTLYYPGAGILVTSSRSTAIDVQVSEPTTDKDAVTITYAGTSRAFYALSSSGTNINGTSPASTRATASASGASSRTTPSAGSAWSDWPGRSVAAASSKVVRPPYGWCRPLRRLIPAPAR